MIRQITLDEYDKCNNIWDMEKCPFTKQFINEIQEGNRQVFVYEKDGAFIGEGNLVKKHKDIDYIIPQKRIYLSRLIVKKEYRGQGIGSAITSFLIEKAKEMGYSEISLGVDCDNENALKLYLKFGFEIFKKDSDEYGEYFKMLKSI